jgi:hypothetical protein
VTEARLILLTVSEAELRRRYERKPDLYFSLEKIQATNARSPSLLPLLPASLPHLQSPDEAFARLDAFIR